MTPSFIHISQTKKFTGDIPAVLEGNFYQCMSSTDPYRTDFFVHLGRVPRFEEKGLLAIAIEFPPSLVEKDKASLGAAQYIKQYFQEVLRNTQFPTGWISDFDLYFAANPAQSELSEDTIRPYTELYELLEAAFMQGEQYYTSAAPANVTINNTDLLIVFQRDDIGELNKENQS